MVLKKLFYGLLGIFLLPAVAGLGRGAFRLLVDLQMDGNAARMLIHFTVGAGFWLLVFVFLSRPVRTYVLAHELSHLLAAWLSGVGTGRMRVGADSGSIEVARSSIWIALAPYMIPFYSLTLLALHFLASLWWEPDRWSATLPFALGVTWSFHISFTACALFRGQSDLKPYGWLGALPVILLGNLLLLCLAMAAASPIPFLEEAAVITSSVQEVYAAAFHLMEELVVWNIGTAVRDG